MSTKTLPLDLLDAELANLCAALLKMALTAAQAHAKDDPSLVESIARLSEARLVVHALAHDLEVELLAPAADGGTACIFRLQANSAPAWTLQ